MFEKYVLPYRKKAIGNIKLQKSPFKHLYSTLKKPQMPPPLLVSPDTLGSSCSSGNVIGDPVSNPPLMTDCWSMGLDTTPENMEHFLTRSCTFLKINQLFAECPLSICCCSVLRFPIG